MGLFSRKKKIIALQAIADGEIIPLNEVNDSVFSTKMMGDGFAVKPDTGDIYAPAAGEITSIFPTKHALGLKTDTGVEFLIHVGLDTVELKGAPFKVHVQEGERVVSGQLILTADLVALQVAGKENTSMVIVTNMDQIQEFGVLNVGVQAHGTVVQTLTMN